MDKTNSIELISQKLHDYSLQLMPEERTHFFDSLEKFLFKFTNSKNFEKKCMKQVQQGLDPLGIWLEKGSVS